MSQNRLDWKRFLHSAVAGSIAAENRGNGAHAPNEYYVIESTNPKVEGMMGAVRSQVDYLYELASVS